MQKEQIRTAAVCSLIPDGQECAVMPLSTLLWMHQQMLLIRTFEEKLLALKDDNLINGPVHTSVGQEAVAVGAALAVRRQDKFTGTHRAHHQYLAKALSTEAPPSYDPLKSGLNAEMQAHILTLLKEIMGLAGGCSGGRGGSMHLYNSEIGIAGTNAIVGGGVPSATGIAWADRMRGGDEITIAFFGDGALYQGVIHESCNLAALWKAPVIYAIENNQYAVGTSRHAGCSAENLCQVALAYGRPGFKIDGMDAACVKLALDHILSDRDNLPCFLEINTYRYYHHAGRTAGSAFGYRGKEEETFWREHDPIETSAARLLERGVRQNQLDQLQQQAKAAVDTAATEVLMQDTSGITMVKPELWPSAGQAAFGLRDTALDATGPFVESEQIDCPRKTSYSEAIAAVTGLWLKKDPTVVVMGEEVANFGGGAYGATKGLPQEFPDRVLNTPITEAGFSGLACGAAMNGMHPIIELMFSSFCLVAADQLFNQIGQLGHIYGGHVSVPLVCRTRIAAGLGYGAQHSMDPVGLFTMFPGWRVVAPTTPFDYIGLFNAAMKLKSPTLIVEHHGFYGDQGMIPAGDPEHVVEIGRARIRRAGQDATVLAYGWGVRLAEQAAEQLGVEGISVEVIDLRTLDDAGLDYETIGQSLMKTGVLVTVEEAQTCNGIGPKLIRACEQRWFDYLDGPSACVNALDIPLPVSRPVEKMCLPDIAQTADIIRKAAKRQV